MLYRLAQLQGIVASRSCASKFSAHGAGPGGFLGDGVVREASTNPGASAFGVPLLLGEFSRPPNDLGFYSAIPRLAAEYETHGS